MGPSANSPSAGKMTFHLRGNGGNLVGSEWIAAEGEIVSETATDLENFIKSFGYSENPGGWSIRLNSPGGDLEGGIRLGELIRKLKLNTEIGATEPDFMGIGRGCRDIARRHVPLRFLADCHVTRPVANWACINSITKSRSETPPRRFSVRSICRRTNSHRRCSSIMCFEWVSIQDLLRSQHLRPQWRCNFSMNNCSTT